jgi:hypothetical protein
LYNRGYFAERSAGLEGEDNFDEIVRVSGKGIYYNILDLSYGYQDFLFFKF